AVAAVQPRVTQGPRPVQVGRPANHGLATCVIHRVIRHVDAEKAVAIRDLLWLHVQMDEHLDECAGRRGGGVQHGSSLAVPSTRRKQAAATIQTGVTAQSPEPQAKIPCSICSNRSVTTWVPPSVSSRDNGDSPRGSRDDGRSIQCRAFSALPKTASALAMILLNRAKRSLSCRSRRILPLSLRSIVLRGPTSLTSSARAYPRSIRRLSSWGSRPERTASRAST